MPFAACPYPLSTKFRIGCGQVHNIFHSPVDIAGRTQSERIMQKAIMEGGAIVVGMYVVDSFSKFTGEGIYDKKPWERIDHRKGHAITLIGWGNENGKKFWWAKNSWGSASPVIFKYARGKDCLGIESIGASWLTADPPGKAPSKSLKVDSGSNPEGFCPDSLLSENLLANDKFKVKHSCVSLKCYSAGCNLKFTWDCNILKRTYVDIVSDSAADTISTWFPKEVWIKSASACIQNVYN